MATEVLEHANPMTAHILALRDCANTLFDELYGSPERMKIRKTAIALCQAYRGGDPFMLTMGGKNIPLTIAGNEAVAVMYPLQPAWVTFAEQADIAIKAIESADDDG